MKWLPIIGCFMVLFLGRVSAQDPQIRAHLETGDETWVGQKITLVVELLAPGYFAGSPSFALPSIPGVLVMPPEGSPVVSTEDVNGVSYTVQRHELAVFAQRAGPQSIPSFAVKIGYKRSPLDKEVVSQSLKTPALPFTAQLPPGAEHLGTVLSARDLKVDEAWQPQPDQAKPKAGDSFTRTLTFSAPDVPGMAFPPFPTPELDGIGIYPQEPIVQDHSERGTMSGQRRDTIRYVCKRPGHFIIAAARLTWWDLESKQLRTLDFPARAFDVAPNPALASAAPEAIAAPSHRKAFAAAALVALLLTALAVRFWKAPIWAAALRVVAFFRPVHLQPLNPLSSDQNS